MGLIRDSFVIFKNWAEAINTLPEEYQLETYKGLVEYGLNGSIPENLSPIANAMLISFSSGMENNILRYKASVENGKKGGRPKNLEKPNETQENLEKPNNNLEKPNETQHEKLKTRESLDKPNPNPYVNVNVNDISQSINNKISINALARVREELLEKFKEYSLYVFGEDKRVFEEIVEVLATAIVKIESEAGLKFRGKQIPVGYFDGLDFWQIKKIVFQVENNQEIENRNLYILAALINRVEEMKNEKHTPK